MTTNAYSRNSLTASRWGTLIMTWLLALLCSAPVWAEEKPRAPDAVLGATLVDAKWVKKALDDKQGVVIVDARIASEYAEGHLPGALNTDGKHVEQLPNVLPANKTTPVLFYCNGPKCIKSSALASRAVELGYSQVYWFRGGVPEWVSHGFPLE